MSTQSKLSESAKSAIEAAMKQTRESTIQLSAEQKACTEEFKVADKALTELKEQNESARSLAHKAVDEEFNGQRKAIDKDRGELRKEYKARLIEMGVKDPDMVLSDTKVVKTLDKGLKRSFGFLGRVKKYVGTAIEAGEIAQKQSSK